MAFGKAATPAKPANGFAKNNNAPAKKWFGAKPTQEEKKEYNYISVGTAIENEDGSLGVMIDLSSEKNVEELVQAFIAELTETGRVTFRLIRFNDGQERKATHWGSKAYPKN